MMCKDKRCGNFEHYHANSNIDLSHGICKVFEALVYYDKDACGWYCKQRSDME